MGCDHKLNKMKTSTNRPLLALPLPFLPAHSPPSPPSFLLMLGFTSRGSGQVHALCIKQEELRVGKEDLLVHQLRVKACVWPGVEALRHAESPNNVRRRQDQTELDTAEALHCESPLIFFLNSKTSYFFSVKQTWWVRGRRSCQSVLRTRTWSLVVLSSEGFFSFLFISFVPCNVRGRTLSLIYILMDVMYSLSIC